MREVSCKFDPIELSTPITTHLRRRGRGARACHNLPRVDKAPRRELAQPPLRIFLGPIAIRKRLDDGQGAAAREQADLVRRVRVVSIMPSAYATVRTLLLEVTCVIIRCSAPSRLSSWAMRPSGSMSGAARLAASKRHDWWTLASRDGSSSRRDNPCEAGRAACQERRTEGGRLVAHRRIEQKA